MEAPMKNWKRSESIVGMNRIPILFYSILLYHILFYYKEENHYLTSPI